MGGIISSNFNLIALSLENSIELNTLAFVITVKTDNVGTTTDNQFYLPIVGTDFTVETSEQTLTGLSTAPILQWTNPGTYQISVTGTFSKIYFNADYDKDKLISINQWGTTQWTYIRFRYCSNLLEINAIDIPDLTLMTGLLYTFSQCYSLHTINRINDWVTDNMSSAQFTFDRCQALTSIDLSNWNTSNFTNINALFNVCIALTSINLSGWDVRKVTYMRYTFTSCTELTNLNIDNWITSSLYDIQNIFQNCVNLVTLNIGSWDTSNLYNIDYAFRNLLDIDYLHIDTWDFSSITSASVSAIAGTNLTTDNYDAILVQMNTQVLKPDIEIDFGTNQYTVIGQTAKNSIIANYNWTFVDGGLATIEEFIITVKTDNSGSTSSNQFLLPIYGTDFTVETSEQILTNLSAPPTLTWTVAGTYQVKVSGTFSYIYFNTEYDKDKLISVDNWGIVQWTQMINAFYGCTNMSISASDAPDLSICTDFSRIFRSTYFDSDINHWDVSNIQNMYQAFCFGANNCPLDLWNVSNVTNFDYVFRGNATFNQPINSWNTSKGTRMYAMFYGATNFNQNLNLWDTGLVETMEHMFRSASNFNGDISTWDVKNVTNMRLMLFGIPGFNQDLSGWNIVKVTTFEDFATNSTFSITNYDKILIAWEQLPLVNTYVNLNMGNSQYSNSGQTARTSIISSKHWTIYDNGLTAFPDEIPFIITIKTDNIGTTNDNQFLLPIIGADFDVITSEQTLTSLSAAPTLTWSVPGTYTVEVRGTYTQIKFNNEFDKSKLIYIDKWSNNLWLSMENSFQGCNNLTGCDSVAPDLSSVTNMKRIFSNCSLFNGNISTWNVSTITSMEMSFYFASVFNNDISSWNVTNVATMKMMFTAALQFNIDISSWNVFNTTNMSYMFNDAVTFNKNIGNWSVDNVLYMEHMFNGATSFNQDLSNWDVSKVLNFTSFATNVSFSSLNYNLILISWSALNLTDGLTINFGNSMYYASGEIAKNSIISDDTWTFVDGGLDPNPQVFDIKFGRYYNWNVIDTITPTGLIFPEKTDWETLTAFLGNDYNAGGPLKEIGTETWLTPNSGATDAYGFKGLGAGYRDADGIYNWATYQTLFWSIDSLNAQWIYTYALVYINSNLSPTSVNKQYGASLRFMVDSALYSAGDVYTDLDGNTYDIIAIGTQLWLAQNWACTKYADGSPIAKVLDATIWSGLTSGAYCEYNNDPTTVYY